VGFVPVAGAASIGEHSYDSADTPIATGRPDAEDLRKAKAFGAAVRDRVQGLVALDGVSLLQVPGDFPYQDRFKEPQGAPVTQNDLCTRCGECAAACPVGAIEVADLTSTDVEACILCSACVKVCPTGARVWEHAWVKLAAKWLAENCAVRKEPEMYL